MNFEQQNPHQVTSSQVTSSYHQLFDHHGNHHVGEVPQHPMTTFMLHGGDHQRSAFSYHPYHDMGSSRGHPQQMFFSGAAAHCPSSVGEPPYYIAPPIATMDHHSGFVGGKYPGSGLHSAGMRVMHEIEEVGLKYFLYLLFIK